MKPGERAVITHIDSGDGQTVAKLAARGIVPGISTVILRSGDPLLVGVENERWAINAAEASCIHVERTLTRRRSLRAWFSRR